MKQHRPILHGRDHAPGGTDPIPGLPGGSYADAIISHPCLLHYWPADESAGDLLDRKGTVPLVPTFHTWTPPDEAPQEWPQYGLEGPTPNSAAVKNWGYYGGLPADLGRFASDTAITVPAPLTVELWAVLQHKAYVSDGTEIGSCVALSDSSFQLSVTSGGSSDWQEKLAVSYGGGSQVYDPAELPLDQWHHIAIRSDGATVELWRNGVQVASAAGALSLAGQLAWLGLFTGSTGSPWDGMSAQLAIYGCALTDDEITSHVSLRDADNTDMVLGVDDDGNVGWVEPKIDVTVNAAPPPKPKPPPPPASGDPPAGIDEWIRDQPFTYGGSSFEVPPRKWTTIPFTSPLLERQSNRGPATAWEEIDWDDPDAAGWIDPATPRVITIPHDMLYRTIDTVWMQIALRLESPSVQEVTSYRALRVFETTHQKTLLELSGRRDQIVSGDGSMYVFVDPARDPDTVFATRGDGAVHDNFMFAPNSNYGFSQPGDAWLPRNSIGDPIVKKGMRLVPQVWHDATVALTFSCAPVPSAPEYKPHFVVAHSAEQAWGPPWSTWYP